MLLNDHDLSYIPTLPQAPEVETSILAALFAEQDKPEVTMAIMGSLTAEDFYQSIHQEVFKACLEQFNAGKPIAEDFVNDRLRANLPHIDLSGEFVANLKWQYTGSGNLEESIHLLKSKATNRKLITEFFKLISDKRLSHSEELLERVQTLMLSVSQHQTTKTEASLAEILPGLTLELEERLESKQTLRGVSSGFSKLDSWIGGLQKTRLITLCAQTGIGKTSFATALATNVARYSEKPVLYCSLEMSKEELAERIVCQTEGIDATLLQSGALDVATYQRFLNGLVTLGQVPLIIDDAPQSLASLKAKARRVMAQQGELGLLVVDYLGLLTSDDSKANRYQQVSALARGLKNIALELKIPVLALAQPNREVNKRGDNKLRLSDMKDSGEIEQASDLVLFLNRTKGGANVELDIAKQRNGPNGTILFHFTPETTSFREAW